MKYNHAIKRHLKASSPKLLEIAMLKNNIQRGMFFHYDVMESDGKWYAWYLDEDSNNPIEKAKDLLNGVDEK